MSCLLLLGRILFSAIFILGSINHFKSGLVSYAASQGVPYAPFLVPLSGVLALLGGLSILLGYKARWGAWLLIIFLLPITFMIHKFWAFSNPADATVQQIMFMKNLSMMGAALMITYFGSGPWSLRS